MLFQRRIHATDNELSAYLDGRIADLKERVVQHLEACTVCQDALDGLRAVQTSLRALPRPQARRSFAVREADVRPAPRAARIAGLTPYMSGIAAVAAIAFFVTIGVDLGGGVSRQSGKSATTSGSPASSDHAAAPSIGGAESIDPDGAQKRSVNREAADATAAANQGAFGDDVATDAYPAENSLQYSESDRLATSSAAASQLMRFGDAQPPQVTPELARDASTGDSGSDDTGMRIAEGVLAAVALVSGGGAFALWRRRAA